MPKLSQQYTKKQIERIQKTGITFIGHEIGLCIEVTKKGKANYVLRTTFQNRQRQFHIGARDKTSLSQAISKARDIKQKLSEGIDPKKKNNLKDTSFKTSLSFFDVADRWIKERALNNFWKYDKRGQLLCWGILKNHVFPIIGRKPVNEIDARDIKQILVPLWQEHNNVARKVLTHLRAIFRWSIAMGYRENLDNPASLEGALGVLLEAMSKNIKHAKNFSALQYQQVPYFIKDLLSLSSVSAQALLFSILTASRTKAIITAVWNDIDLKNRTWTLTIDNDKIKKEDRDRRILLSNEAVDLLKQLPRNGNYVFCSQNGKPLSNMAMTEVIRGLHKRKKEVDSTGWIDEKKSNKYGKQYVITQHGTARSCFRTWAREFTSEGKKFDQEAVEMCLLHSKNDVYGGAYDRSDLFRERREIMDAWGKFCFSQIDPLQNKDNA